MENKAIDVCKDAEIRTTISPGFTGRKKKDTPRLIYSTFSKTISMTDDIRGLKGAFFIS
jgi:hypothetical protein